MKAPFTLEQAKKIGDRIGVDWKKTSPEWFYKGMLVELEHGSKFGKKYNVTKNSPLRTGQIAGAHEHEFPGYYKELEKMEKKLSLLKKTAADKKEKKKGSIWPTLGLGALAASPLAYLAWRGMRGSPVGGEKMAPQVKPDSAKAAVISRLMSGVEDAGEKSPFIGKATPFSEAVGTVTGLSNIGSMIGQIPSVTKAVPGMKVFTPLSGLFTGADIGADPYTKEWLRSELGNSAENIPTAGIGAAVGLAAGATPLRAVPITAAALAKYLYVDNLRKQTANEAMSGKLSENMANMALGMQRSGATPKNQANFLSMLKFNPGWGDASGGGSKDIYGRTLATPGLANVIRRTGQKLNVNPDKAIGRMLLNDEIAPKATQSGWERFAGWF